MQNIKGVFLALIFLLLSTNVYAAKPVVTIGEAPALLEEKYESCSKYYKFGSLEMNLFLDKSDSEYAPNQEMELRGSIKNLNGYPITAGKIMAQVFLKGTNADYLMDEFFVKDSSGKDMEISLSQNGVKDFSFKYLIPSWGQGNYYFKINYLWNSKRIISQSSPLNFKVFGDLKTKYLLESLKVKVNEKDFYSDNYAEYNVLENANSFEIKYLLKNPENTAGKIMVDYKIYKINSFDEKNAKVKESEEFEISANSEKTISKNFAKLDPGFYVFQIMASGQGIKTISRFNILVPGENMGARINFAAINDFPIIPKSSAFGFVCYNSFSEKYPFKGKLNLKLRDSFNNIIFTANTDKFSSLQNIALKNEFLLDKKYSKLWLDITLVSDSGYTVDQTTLEYNCSDMKNVGGFQISVSGLTVRAIAQNKCGEKVLADILVEVKEKNGNVIFSDASYGQDFNKKVKFQAGKEYEIKASSQGFQDIIVYKHSSDNKIAYFVIGLALVVALAFAVNYFSKKQSNPPVV